MFTSTLKSFALCAILSASHASAAIQNFDINFLALTTDFGHGGTNEITLNYEIGTGRDSYKVDLFAKGCTDTITGTTVSTVSATTAKDTSHDSLEILLDLNKATIASQNSNIWNKVESELELCTRVQVLSGATIIAEEARDIGIDFDFGVDFEATSVNFTQASLISGSSGTATMSDYVQACKCDSATSFTCNTNALGPRSVMNICIKVSSTDMYIDYIQSLIMTQDTTEMQLIDGGNIQNTAITTATHNETHNGVFVSSLIPVEFFSYETAGTAQVTGLVYLRFSGSRRLAVEIAGQQTIVAASSTTRALINRFGDQVSPFVVDLELEKNRLRATINAAQAQSGYVVFTSTVIATIISIAMAL